MLWTFIITSLTFLVMYAFYYEGQYTERYVWLAGYAATFIVTGVTGIESGTVFLSLLVWVMAATWLILALGGKHE